MKSFDIDLLELNSKAKIPLLTAEDINTAKEYGILRPVIVIKNDTSPEQAINQKYKIIGETRSWLLAQKIGANKVPVHIVDVKYEENIQSYFNSCEGNNDTNPIKEAKNIQQLKERMQIKSNAEIALILGKTRTAISHKLRLLTLTPQVGKYVETCEISEGQARPLVTLKKEAQIKLAKIIISKKLSVREIENRCKNVKKGLSENNKHSINTTSLEKLLSDKVGSSVIIEKGKMVINFHNDFEILEGILNAMGIIKL